MPSIYEIPVQTATGEAKTFVEYRCQVMLEHTGTPYPFAP